MTANAVKNIYIYIFKGKSYVTEGDYMVGVKNGTDEQIVTTTNDPLPNKKEEFKQEVSLELEVSSFEEKLLDHVFLDPVVAEHYRKIYDDHEYECRHLFDPDFTWTPQEERKVVWKNDYYVTFWCFIMFTALNFDRSNLQQALSDNLLEDLNITANQLNTGNTINLVCFLAAEIPAQLISKKIGADVWIPAQMTLWSIVSMCQVAMTNVHGFYATRALLGLLQGGFICDICLWMSYFFTSTELPMRLSLFYISLPLTAVWSSLLAFALLKIKAGAIQEGWRWLFLIEGAFTLIIGILSFFKMPASVVQTKTWYRKKGWYTDREEKIIVNKVLRDDPQKGDMHNREPVSFKELFIALFDYDLVPIYFIRFLGDIGAYPAATYFQIILRRLGFSTFATNALTIPYNVASIFSMLALGFFSEYFHTRSMTLISNSIWILACLFPLRYWPGAQVNAWGTYALLTVALSAPVMYPVTISWCSSNSNSVRSRAVSAAVVNMFSQLATIVSSNIYRDDDAPLYHRGNEDLIGIAFGTLGLCIVARFYYPFRNRQKQKKWNAMTEEERQDYVHNSTDEGNKRLDFRFVH